MKIKMVTLILMALLVGTVQQTNAFYNPSTGRWLSRDPIREKAFRAHSSRTLNGLTAHFVLSRDRALQIPEYSYVVNNAVSETDVLGLWISAGIPIPNPRTTTVTCDGSGHLEPRLGRPLPDYSPLCLARCFEEHEWIHCLDIQNSNPNICVGVTAGTAIIPSNQAERKASEIRAYNQEKTCLNNYLEDCPQVCSPSNIKARIIEVEMDIKTWEAFVPDAGNPYPAGL